MAETLITLGIIGIVAAMTLPSLIGNHKKKEAVVMLKKAYSEINQALARAEADYGTIDTWDFSNYATSNERINTFSEYYLKPYIKVLYFCSGDGEITDNSKCWAEKVLKLDGSIEASKLSQNGVRSFMTPAGYSVLYWLHGTGRGGHFIVDVNGPKKGPNQMGKDIFRFILTFKEAETAYNDTSGYQPGLRGYGLNNTNTREDLLKNCSTSDNGYFCSGLIMFDGWEMSKDYPW